MSFSDRPFLLFVVFVSLFAIQCSARPVKDLYAVAEGIQGYWGHHKPYKPKGTWSQQARLPKGCTIDKVIILERHGSRYPLDEMDKDIKKTLKRLAPVKAKETKGTVFHFLQKEYDLGSDAGKLLPLGSTQSSDAGKEAFKRYSTVLPEGKTSVPFVRASKRKRVQDSAAGWIKGFSEASGRSSFKTDVEMEPGPKSTLIDKCPNQDPAGPRVDEWVQVYAKPIADRLNKAAKDLGAVIKLEPYDVYQLQSLCALESQILMKKAPVCAMFTAKSDWQGYEYATDILKYYTSGYGQRLGAVRGVGWVNELISRLTGNGVQDETSTDRSLYENPEKFPQDRTMYTDLSHDDLLVAVYAAMGLFKPQFHLPTEQILPKRTWKSGYLVPFAGRMVVERLDCSPEKPAEPVVPKKKTSDKTGKAKKGSDENEKSKRGTKKTTQGENPGTPKQTIVYRGVIPKNKKIRIFVADELQPQGRCGGKTECDLKEFIMGQSFALGNKAKEQFKECWSSKK